MYRVIVLVYQMGNIHCMKTRNSVIESCLGVESNELNYLTKIEDRARPAAVADLVVWVGGTRTYIDLRQLL